MKKIFCLLCFFASFMYYGQAPIKNVDAPAFKKLVDEKKGMIKGVMEIDFLPKDSEAAIEKLDKNKLYLVYCAGGGRSGNCATLMQKPGFKDVTNLEKGFDIVKK